MPEQLVLDGLDACGSTVAYQMFTRAQYKCVFALYIQIKTTLSEEMNGLQQ